MGNATVSRCLAAWYYLLLAVPCFGDGLVFSTGELALKEDGVTGVFRGEIALENTSKGPIELEMPVTTCSCTQVRLEARRLAAGEKLSVPVVISTGGLVGRKVEGVRFRYHDGNPREFNLTVIAEIPRMAEADQMELHWESSNETKFVAIRLLRGLVEGAATLRTEQSDNVEIKIADAGAGGSHRVAVSPRAGSNRFDELLKIQVSAGGHSQVIMIYASRSR